MKLTTFTLLSHSGRADGLGLSNQRAEVVSRGSVYKYEGSNPPLQHLCWR